MNGIRRNLNKQKMLIQGFCLKTDNPLNRMGRRFVY